MTEPLHTLEEAALDDAYQRSLQRRLLVLTVREELLKAKLAHLNRLQAKEGKA